MPAFLMLLYKINIKKCRGAHWAPDKKMIIKIFVWNINDICNGYNK